MCYQLVIIKLDKINYLTSFSNVKTCKYVKIHSPSIVCGFWLSSAKFCRVEINDFLMCYLLVIIKLDKMNYLTSFSNVKTCKYVKIHSPSIVCRFWLSSAKFRRVEINDCLMCYLLVIIKLDKMNYLTSFSNVKTCKYVKIHSPSIGCRFWLSSAKIRKQLNMINIKNLSGCAACISWKWWKTSGRKAERYILSVNFLTGQEKCKFFILYEKLKFLSPSY